MNGANTFFQKHNKKIFSFIILIIVGQILNMNWPHRHYQFNQWLLLFMLIIQLNVLKKIKIENAKIRKTLSEKHEAEVLGSFARKAEKFISPTTNHIVSCGFIIIYIYSMFKVGCLEFTPTGYYGGILGAIVFYIGIQAYQRYIALLYFAADLRNLKIKNYFFYFPASTEWIDQLAHEFSYIEKWFLALGLMYSTIYAVNLPVNTVRLDTGISFHTDCNFLFILTWLGILLFFAFAVPTFTFLSRHYIKECIYSCKRVSINCIEQQITILSIQSTETELNLISQKLLLIKEILESDNYPVKYSRTVFDSAYAICFAMITLISPMVSIIEPFMFNG